MNASNVKKAFSSISDIMTENKDYLIELDQQNGDGDLGISMSNGFKAVADALQASDELDLGRIFMNASKVFNESSPSSLGTILSFGMMGMAKALKGSVEADTAQLANAMEAGLILIMEKAGSKPGEKTVLDALAPGIAALRDASGDVKEAFKMAAEAAAKGSESTKEMRSVHGRAAYYADKSIGVLDGGSVAGRLIFEGIYNAVR